MRKKAKIHYVHGMASPTARQQKRRYIYLLFAAFWILSSSQGLLSFYKLVNNQQPQLSRITRLAPEVSFINTQQPLEDVKQIKNQKALTKLLDKWRKQNPEHQWSIAIASINDSSSVTSGSGQYAPASLYKILLMPLLFERYSLNDLEKVQLLDMSLSECVSKMLIMSDNPCGEELGNQLGWNNVANYLNSRGYEAYPDIITGVRITTNGMNRFMIDLYKNKLTTEKQTKYIFDLLSKQKIRAGIPAGCHGCEVMNKTGDNLVRHDTAIIKRAGDIYALTVLTNGASYSDIASLTKYVFEQLDELDPPQLLEVTR